MSSNLKSQAIKGVFWNSVERFSIQGVQFVLGLIMTRLLTPSDYGIIGMLAIFMSISQVFIDGGFASALIQRKDRTESDLCTAFYVNMGVSIICYLLLYSGAPYIARFYNQPILVSVTRVYSIGLIISSLVAVNKTKLTIAMDFKTLSKISLIAALLSGLTGIYFAYTGYAVWALVIQMLANNVITLGLTYYYVRWLPTRPFSLASFRNLFSFGFKLTLASLINSVYTNLYSLAIGKKFTPDKLGFYARADQFARMASVNLAGILSTVAFPLLSQIQDDDKKLVEIYSKYVQVSAFVSFPLVLGLGGIAKPLIEILLTDKWMESAILLQILVFAYLWDSVILVNLNLLKVKGRTDLFLRLEIYKKSIAFVILFCSLFFNLRIICLGLAVYGLIALYMNTYYTKKLLGYGFRKQFGEIFPYLAFSLITSAEAYFLCEFLTSPWLGLGLSLIIAPLTYVALCYRFKAMPLQFINNLLVEKGILKKHYL